MPQYRLTDLNGATWLQQGSHVTPRYVRGVDGASFEFDTSKGVDQRGVTVKGIDYQPGVIELGAVVHPHREGITGQPAVDILSAWRSGLGLGDALVEGGDLMEFRLLDSDRFQMVRLLKKGPADWEKMRVAGLFFDEIQLQSDESDWRADPIDVTFTAGQFATATVDNDGDYPSWPWFKLTGPITGAKLGLGDEQVALPTLTAGQSLTIETDPNWYAINDQTGADRTFEVTSLAMAAEADDRWRTQAPARGDGITVNISGTATTSATSLRVVVPQLYRSAL